MGLDRIDRRRREHTGSFRTPSPLDVTGLWIQRIECVRPVAENNLLLVDKRLAFHEAGDAVAGPYKPAAANLQRPEHVVGRSHIGNTVLDDGSGQHGFLAAVTPAKPSVLQRQAINEAVGRAYDHPLFPNGGRREDLSSSGEPPDFPARVGIQRLDDAGLVGIEHQPFGQNGSAADISLVLAPPDFRHLREFPVDIELQERIVERQPIRIVPASSAVGLILGRNRQRLGVPRIAVEGSAGLAFSIHQNPLVCRKDTVPDLDDVVTHFLSPIG